MSTSGVGSTSGSSSSSSTSGSSSKAHSLADMDSNSFLKLLITELQQQDPMSPMETSDMINQISQIRSIQSNTQMTDTLKSVSLGQSISTAGSLIGRSVKGLDSDSNRVEGVVDSVSVSDSKPVLHIGGSQIELNNVTDILPVTGSTSGS